MKVKYSVLILISLFVMTTNYTKAQNTTEFRQPYPLGEKNTAFSQYFIGQSYLYPITNNRNLNVPMFNVTFEPACRNNWHKHAGGQILIVTAGVGYYQQKGMPAQRLHCGDVVEIAPNTEHWHGAAPDSWFAHIAVECNPSIQGGTTWLAPVEDEQYLKACSDAKNRYEKENMVLSERQQAIVSMGNYVAQGNLQMLKISLVSALESNMTVNEIKELLVQSYAYCGFPRSLRALGTFNDLLKERKVNGISDNEGIAFSKQEKDSENKYLRGAEVLEQLTGISKDAPKGEINEFAPAIDTFLKEHLFCDIFERNLLSYKERELFTVSLLVGLSNVEPMAQAHMAMCINIGITRQQLSALLNISETNLGHLYTDSLRVILNNL